MSSDSSNSSSSESDSGSDSEMEQDVPPPKREIILHGARHTTTGRVVDSVPAPASKVLEWDEVFDQDGKPRPEVIKQHFIREGRMHEDHILKIVTEAQAILAQEPNLLEVAAPATDNLVAYSPIFVCLSPFPCARNNSEVFRQTLACGTLGAILHFLLLPKKRGYNKARSANVLRVCGDIHGQYYDLMKLLEIGGDPSSTRYLFLGDYVDRGYFSLECVVLLYSYKILYPTTFFMIRGNHECRHLTDYFTFKEEVQHKYSLTVYDAIMDSFDHLPLAAVLNNQFLCVHGGLSPEIKHLSDIQKINRVMEPPPSGAMCDLLWADPMEDFDPDVEEYFLFNQVRGCSYSYSYRAVCDFLNENSLLSVIRAHEAQDAGYRMHRKTSQGFPSVITLFSAPNYLDAYNNKGAVLRYEEDVLNIRQFTHSPHPYWLPSFMDVFTWSIPFVSEKVAEILLVFLKCVDESEDAVHERAEQEVARKKSVFKAKVQAVTHVLRMYQAMRKERQTTMVAPALAPSVTIEPQPALLSSTDKEIKNAIGNFEKVKEIDRANEKRPPPSLERRGSNPTLTTSSLPGSPKAEVPRSRSLGSITLIPKSDL